MFKSRQLILIASERARLLPGTHALYALAAGEVLRAYDWANVQNPSALRPIVVFHFEKILI